MMSERAGGCMCGSVRYRLLAPPLFVHCCHCTECQRQNGSAFALNAMIERECVAVTKGATAPGRMPAASGRGQEVHRCGGCGVILWSHYAGAGKGVAFVRVGTLDAPGDCPPDIHIFTRWKQPWVVIPPDARAVPVYYERQGIWPEESLRRLAAAKAQATRLP
jgi:hypothetical protein